MIYWELKRDGVCGNSLKPTTAFKKNWVYEIKNKLHKIIVFQIKLYKNIANPRNTGFQKVNGHKLSKTTRKSIKWEVSVHDKNNAEDSLAS